MKDCMTVICQLSQLQNELSTYLELQKSTEPQLSKNCHTALSLSLLEVVKNTCVSMDKLLVMVSSWIILFVAYMYSSKFKQLIFLLIFWMILDYGPWYVKKESRYWRPYYKSRWSEVVVCVNYVSLDSSSSFSSFFFWKKKRYAVLLIEIYAISYFGAFDTENLWWT